MVDIQARDRAVDGAPEKTEHYNTEQQHRIFVNELWNKIPTWLFSPKLVKDYGY